MWKFVSRGVREAVERNLNIGRSTEVRVQKEKPQVQYCQRLAPYVNDKWKHCGSSRSDNGNQKKEQTSTSFKDSWFSAFSCSGALALGWVLSHPCVWRKWIGLSDNRPREHRRIRFSDLIQSTTAWTQPIGPGAVTTINFCNELSDGPSYGPKTAEEALDEAAEEFRAVHNSILAEVENKRGVDLIKRKKNREALELFISASHRGNGPAAYNLAQCFELGIGIKQNFHEAAKWYQTAVDRGHLTAMYNLGVFYVHGWGGLKQDTKRARQLFNEAAKQGQPDAKAALGMKEAVPEIPSVPVGDGVKQDSWNSSSDDFSTPLIDISHNADEIFKLASSFESSVDPDPVTSQLMLELYKIAADMGHREAKSRAQVLAMIGSFGMLKEEEAPRDEKRTLEFSVGNFPAFSC
ncbi:hypothetical protein GE061_010574 [Apolygus lucorum]|uniref:Protein SHC1 n=1 Tax=Apolygus lucorum TaxID=248454 RepID=A0A6A4JQ84_APOLU|nr:hypothetical protein GE061_010574 [Apolygus lucorum]